MTTICHPNDEIATVCDDTKVVARTKRRKSIFMSPCSVVMNAVNKHITYRYRKQYDSNPTAAMFRLCSNTNIPQTETNTNDNDEVITTFTDHIYNEMVYILTKYPTIIHDVNASGHNILHIVCSNPILIPHLKLIQLLVSISEIVMEHGVETDPRNSANNDSNANQMENATHNRLNNPYSNGKANPNDIHSTNSLIKKSSTSFKRHEKKNEITEIRKLIQAQLLLPEESSDIITRRKSNPNITKYRSDQTRIPSNALLVRMKCKTTIQQLPFHIALQTIMSLPELQVSSISFDIIEYLIQCYPVSLCTPDETNYNVPLHYICTGVSSLPLLVQQQSKHVLVVSSYASLSVLLEIIILMIQHWPDACKIPNKDGDLPLHVASKICMTDEYCERLYRRSIRMKQRDYQTQQGYIISSHNDIDLLDDLHFENNSHDEGIVVNNDQEPSTDKAKPMNYIKVPVSYIKEQEQRQRQRQRQHLRQKEQNSDLSEKSYLHYHYQYQIEILQYLVDVHPAALKLPNHDGLTPYDIAAQSVTATTMIHYTDNDNNNSNTEHLWWSNHPVIQYLKDPSTYKSYFGLDSCSATDDDFVTTAFPNYEVQVVNENKKTTTRPTSSSLNSGSIKSVKIISSASGTYSSAVFELIDTATELYIGSNNNSNSCIDQINDTFIANDTSGHACDDDNDKFDTIQPWRYDYKRGIDNQKVQYDWDEKTRLSNNSITTTSSFSKMYYGSLLSSRPIESPEHRSPVKQKLSISTIATTASTMTSSSTGTAVTKLAIGGWSKNIVNSGNNNNTTDSDSSEDPVIAIEAIIADDNDNDDSNSDYDFDFIPDPILNQRWVL